MSQEQSLLVVFAVLYLTECLRWMARNAIAFRAIALGRCRPVLAGLYLGNRQGNFLLLNPFLPLGQIFVCHPWPVSSTERAVYSYVSQALTKVGIPSQKQRWVSFANIETVGATANKVLVNDTVLVRCSSEAQARHLAGLIDRLAALPEAQRGTVLDEAREAALDVPSVRARDAYRQSTTTLRALCNLVFVHLFVLTPLAVWWQGIARTLLPFLISMGMLLALILFFFYHSHKTVYPDQKSGRLLQMFRSFVYPIAAIRACDTLSLHLLATYHPLAVARGLCVPETFEALARRVLLDLHYPRPMDHPDDEAAATERLARMQWRATLTRFLHDQHHDVEGWLTTPPEQDPDCISYCPRCHSQYTIAEGTCADCGNTPLRPFA